MKVTFFPQILNAFKDIIVLKCSLLLALGPSSFVEAPKQQSRPFYLLLEREINFAWLSNRRLGGNTGHAGNTANMDRRASIKLLSRVLGSQIHNYRADFRKSTYSMCFLCKEVQLVVKNSTEEE